jgi:hypothetical protein
MRKKIYIHIGPPKTGSTTLQGVLSDQSDSEHPKVYYPEAARLYEGAKTVRKDGENIHYGTNKAINHTNVFNALIGTMIEPSNSQILDGLVAEIAECNHAHVVISSENFFVLDGEIPNFIDSFNQYPVKVLLYIRNPASRIISLYREHVRKGNMTISFTEFLEREWCLLQEHHIINRWANHVGRENIITRSFEEAVAGSGLYYDFIEAIDVDWEGESVPPREKLKNAKMPDQLLWLMKSLSKWQKKCKVGGVEFLICINLKRIISQSSVIQKVLYYALYPLRNRLISDEARTFLSKRINDELSQLSQEDRLLYADYRD